MLIRISIQKIFFSLVVSFCSLQMTACGETHTEGAREVPVDDNYDIASCAYSLNDGPNLLNLSYTPDIQKTYFEKSIDLGKLNKVLPASAEASISFMKTTELEIYKINSDYGRCKMFSSLTLAPKDLQDHWDKVQGDGETSIIVGLYLPKAKKDLTSVSDKAAFLIREDTSRWTLVHEYTHHLFRLEQG